MRAGRNGPHFALVFGIETCTRGMKLPIGSANVPDKSLQRAVSPARDNAKTTLAHARRETRDWGYSFYDRYDNHYI